jgi:hypothetical protein
MDQSYYVGEAIIQMHLFSHMCTSKTVEINWNGHQEQEPPFGGKQIDPTLVFEFQW